MKKIFLISAVVALVLSACASRNSAAPNSADGTFTLPLASKLAVGTIKLEGTKQAVDAKQAAELLPLWQVMKDLETSDTAAQEEKDALAQQIQETMTAAQLQAIDGMQLTMRDVMAASGNSGFAGNGGQFAANTGSSTSGSQNNNRRNGGGFPGGGEGRIPGGGGFGGGGFSPEQIATAQARRAAGTSGGEIVPTALIDAVVTLLQSK
jgi:hypothetical protein